MTSTRRARRSSPSSTPSATPPRPSPRASPSRRPCSRPRRCSAPTATPGRPSCGGSSTATSSPRSRASTSSRRSTCRSSRRACSSALLIGCGGRVPLLRPGDQRGHPRGRRHRLRGAPPVPRAPRDHGRHREARVRPVVDICTRDSLRELATPGLLAALMPVAVGFGLGIGPLAGFLAGAIGTGCLMAVFLANSGGSWDNAKKIVEDGAHGGKGSDAHAATVIGDTVGDPFKDTAGPAINPLHQGDEPGVGAHRPGHRDPDARRRREPRHPLRHRRRRLRRSSSPPSRCRSDATWRSGATPRRVPRPSAPRRPRSRRPRRPWPNPPRTSTPATRSAVAWRTSTSAAELAPA